MKHVQDIVRRHFAVEDGQLTVGGIRVSVLADEFGTPLFVHDLGIVERNLHRLRQALPERFTVFYSVKANPSQGMMRFLLARGCGLEVASGGEFFQAVEAGCKPSAILFAGPGKTREELEYVLQEGVGEIHAESHAEIQRLSDVAEELGGEIPVAIRVNPNPAALGGAMRMGGTASQFGVDEEELEEAVIQVLESPGLRFSGIHLFAGTQILDYRILSAQYAYGMEVALRAARIADQPLGTVDFGGGLGIPYYSGEQELDVASYGRAVQETMRRHADKPELRGTRFLVEPGRYLVGESGVYVSRVVDVKNSRGKTYVVVDGGMNHHLAASGNLGQVIKKNFPVAVLNRLEESPGGPVQIVGPLCTPLDVLARDVSIPAPRIGDVVGVFQSGAYAYSASPLGFLSHPTPAEIHVHERAVELARRRGCNEDFLKGQTSD